MASEGNCTFLCAMVHQMADAEGITEDLKARDQLAWVGRMNDIQQQVEEVVLEEIVYT